MILLSLLEANKNGLPICINRIVLVVKMKVQTHLISLSFIMDPVTVRG